MWNCWTSLTKREHCQHYNVEAETNDYRPSFVSGSHCKEGSSKQWASRIPLLWYGKSIRFNLETRHFDGHTRSRNRRKNVNFHTKLVKPRFFKVKVNEILSDAKVQTKGISQGSVVSPTFFILGMNKIVAQLPDDSRFQISLYMDDLQMSYRHPNWKVVESKLQDSIDIVEKFAQKKRLQGLHKQNIYVILYQTVKPDSI